MCKTINWILFLLFFAGGIYLGVQFGRPHYKYYIFKTDAGDMIHFKDVRYDEMRAHFTDRAKELKIPLLDENFELTRVDDGYKAKLKWTETVTIKLSTKKYEKKYDFEVEAGP